MEKLDPASSGSLGVIGATGRQRRRRRIDNRMIERLWRSIKYECIYRNACETGSQARAGIAKWITDYNAERPHSRHGILTPNEAYDTTLTIEKIAA